MSNNSNLSLKKLGMTRKRVTCIKGSNVKVEAEWLHQNARQVKFHFDKSLIELKIKID
jgi:hypothetical protein